MLHRRYNIYICNLLDAIFLLLNLKTIMRISFFKGIIDILAQICKDFL